MLAVPSDRIASSDAQPDPHAAGEARPAVAEAGGEDGRGAGTGRRDDRQGEASGRAADWRPRSTWRAGRRELQRPAAGPPAAPIDPAAAAERARHAQAVDGELPRLRRRVVRRPARHPRPRPRRDLNRPPPEVEDPDERAASPPRSARSASRARALRAPRRPRSRSRASRPPGGTQLEDVVARVARDRAGRPPERVFGVYRVPDRFDHSRQRGRAYLEWEIAHRPGALPPATDDVLTTAFRRDAHWVARNPGEPPCSTRTSPGRSSRARRARARGLLRADPLLQIRGQRRRRRQELERAHRGRAALHPPAAGGHERAPRADGRGAVRAAAAAGCRTTSRSSTGRRSRRGSRRTAGARRARPRRSRTCRAPAGAAARLPRDRRRPQRGQLRRPGHARQGGLLGDLSTRELRARTSRRKPKLPCADGKTRQRHARGRARRRSPTATARSTSRAGPLARLPARGAARAAWTT